MLEPPPFSRAESTGLFVGVRTFPHDETLTVPYAVDDAVDLAHAFSLNQRVALIPPRRVVLALSGRPRKPDSERRLRELQQAGAKVENATSGDILNLLTDQAAKAGKHGLFVLSLATHGFLHSNGDAYILGSTSPFGSTESALRTATLLDIAGRARRSLVFVDACRDRIPQGTRGAVPDPTAAAPLVRRMSRVHGQVILYAAAPGQYAYDDYVAQNGVFTKAVLDGLDCKASAPRGTVVVETLHTYVEREVRRWIEESRNVSVTAATQVSMEGETRNMPLAQCWRSADPHLRVSTDGSTVTAYDLDTRPLWRRDFKQPIVHAEVADLDADASYEVVVGLGDGVTVLDRDGKPLWTRTGDGLSLRTFTTGDLFRKHTSQIVAIWTDGRSTSRLTVLDAKGEERSAFDHAGLLQHVAIGRPTNMHHPKIAVTSRDATPVRESLASTLFLLDPKKLATRPPLWRQILLGASNDEIRDLRIADANHDNRRDIVVTTNEGETLFTFEGKVVGAGDAGAQWKDAAVRKGRRAR
jgi:hypothetical protein